MIARGSASEFRTAALRGALLACVLLVVAGRGVARGDECVRPAGALGCWATIQEAVDAASPGERIAVHPGTYLEVLVVPADRVQLVGVGSVPDEVVVDGGGAATVVSVGGARVLLKNLTVRNGGNGIEFSGPRGRAVNVRVLQLATNGIVLAPAAEHTVVRNSLVSGAGDRGILVEAPRAVLSGNLVRRTAGVAIEVLADFPKVLGNRTCTVGAGIRLSATGAVVRRNQVWATAGEGIGVSGDRAKIAQNRLIWVDGTGLRAYGDRLAVRQNLVRGGDGCVKIHCLGCTSSLVEGNVGQNIYACAGFTLDADAPGLVARRNLAADCFDEGFHVRGPGVVLVGNEALFNGQSGACGFDVVGDGVVLRGNLSTGNLLGGFRIGGGNLVLRGNRALENLGTGFELDSLELPTADALLVRNVARCNLGEGIALDAGVTGAHLLRNTALSNETDFCDRGFGTVLGTGGLSNRFGTVCPP